MVDILYLLTILAQRKSEWKVINDTLTNKNKRKVSNVLHVFEMDLYPKPWISRPKALYSDQSIKCIQSSTKEFNRR